MSAATLIQAQLARRTLQPFWETLYKICVRGMGYNNYDPVHNGENRVLVRRLRRLAPERDAVVFDVGANEGDFTAQALASRARILIHAFEPNPPTVLRLHRRFAAEPRVHVNACGLSDRPDELRLFDYLEGDGSAHATFRPDCLATIAPTDAATTTPRALRASTVPVTTLDSYAAERGVETIDYLKIDVEGHEPKVLEGASGLIAERRIRCLQIEINAHNAVDGFTLHRLMRVLAGYRCFKILPDGLYPIHYCTMHDMFRYANFFFEADR